MQPWLISLRQKKAVHIVLDVPQEADVRTVIVDPDAAADAAAAARAAVTARQSVRYKNCKTYLWKRLD